MMINRMSNRLSTPKANSSYAYADKLRIWNAKRSFAQLIRLHEGEDCSIDPWLDLLRENPEVASDTIVCAMSPFTKQQVPPLIFFLLVGADEESIELVHELNPNTLSQPIQDDNGVIGLPLHFACTIEKVPEKVICYIINEYPQAVLRKDSSGRLPIHLLLSHQTDIRPAGQKEVAALLDVFDEGFSLGWNVPPSPKEKGKNQDGNEDQNEEEEEEGEQEIDCELQWAVKSDKNTFFSIGFQNSNTQRNVLALLTSRFPRYCNTLRIGSLDDSDETNIFSLNHIHTSLIGKLLPQLTTFYCAAKLWYPRAVSDLLKGLCQQKSLIRLTLYLPNPPDDDTVCPILKQLLQGESSLQYLHLAFGAEYTEDLGMSMSDMGHFNYSVSNNISDNDGAEGGVELALKSLLEGLSENDTLQEFRVSGTWMKPLEKDFFKTHFWPVLAKTLREQNTMLETIDVNFDGEDCSGEEEDMKEVQHWTRLNPCGRKVFRDGKLPFANIVAFLAAFNISPDGPEDEAWSDPSKKITILYGLLRETPTLWCDKAKDPPLEPCNSSAEVVMV